MTDVELDARVTALEENGGSSPQNGEQYTNICVISYINFFQLKQKLIYLTFLNFRYYRLPRSPDILRHYPRGSAVLFTEVLLNEGEGLVSYCI